MRGRVVTIEEIGAFGDPGQPPSIVKTAAELSDLKAFQGHQLQSYHELTAANG